MRSLEEILSLEKATVAVLLSRHPTPEKSIYAQGVLDALQFVLDLEDSPFPIFPTKAPEKASQAGLCM